ncbi:cupin domain-containing protein [Micromonospora sp. URMC 103]|uniref:cupin domain-containing protein n=1 Tax=Micromonospora sp. URMC 103 TaxID=3423406 RepID=UPI003F1A956F
MSFSIQVPDRSDPWYTKRGAVHVPAGEGLTKWMVGDVYTVKLTAAQTNGSLSFIDASVPAGAGPVAHSHADSDEAFYVISGELEFLDGDRTFIGRAGDLVFIPRGHRHRFKNVGVHPARMLFLFTPGGPEGAFVEGGEDPRPGEQPGLWGPERLTRMVELANRYGSEMLPDDDL